ncbi:hypothetical protein [Acidocella aminolytica]|uniref:hypothetical protein n=1 Tax=Acidocella aminolytica TaxID=33998 RepID=UPI001114BB76|nr:hypothetical protein [Acidocella aminolytica]
MTANNLADNTTKASIALLQCCRVGVFASGRGGLPHPVWATMCGIIVSQEELNDTNRVTLWQLTGTVVSVISAVILAVRCWLFMLDSVSACRGGCVLHVADAPLARSACIDVDSADCFAHTA